MLVDVLPQWSGIDWKYATPYFDAEKEVNQYNRDQILD